MPNLFALPVLGASLLGAALVGLQLGESSVGMINPIYFQGPALHPRDRGVALDEPLAAASPQIPYHQLYGWEQGEVERAVACGDCDADWTDRTQYSAVAPYFGEVRYEEPARVRSAPVAHNEDQRSAREASIARYAYYAVTEPVVEEAEVEAVTLVRAEGEATDADAPAALY